MAQLDALLSDLANFDAQHDLEGLRRVRERIISEHPDSEVAVEALYKIGLDLLFRERQLEAAVAKFEEAAKRKAPFWSDAARTSLGLCYYHQQRTQKALLELRKVGYPDKPTAHSVAALAFVEIIYENEGKRDEVKRVRKDRMGQLEQLIKAHTGAAAAPERGYFLLQLGLSARDAGDDKRANEALNEAKALGPDVLGADLFRAVVAALR
jgi:tetratricopeptide (TPR) repeat protein